MVVMVKSLVQTSMNCFQRKVQFALLITHFIELYFLVRPKRKCCVSLNLWKCLSKRLAKGRNFESKKASLCMLWSFWAILVFLEKRRSEIDTDSTNKRQWDERRNQANFFSNGNKFRCFTRIFSRLLTQKYYEISLK